MLEMTRMGNWVVNSLTSSTSPVSEKPLGDVVGRLRPDLAHQLARDLLDEGEEGLEAVADELVGDDVAQEAVLVAVAVLEDVRPEDVLRAELVLAASGSYWARSKSSLFWKTGDDVVVSACMTQLLWKRSW